MTEKKSTDCSSDIKVQGVTAIKFGSAIGSAISGASAGTLIGGAIAGVMGSITGAIVGGAMNIVLNTFDTTSTDSEGLNDNSDNISQKDKE